MRLWRVLTTLLLLALATGMLAWHLRPTGPILDTIMLHQQGWSIAMDAHTGRAFVSTTSPDGSGGQVWLFDSATGRSVHVTTLPDPPSLLTMDMHAGGVLLMRKSAVSLLDEASGEVIRTFQGSASTRALAVNEHTGQIYIAGPNPGVHCAIRQTCGDILRRFDASNGQILSATSVPGNVIAMAVDDRANRLISIDSNSVGRNTVSVFDATTGRLLHTVAPGTIGTMGLHSLVVDEKTGHAFIFNHQHLYMFDIRTGTLLNTTIMTGAAGAMVVDEQTGHLFISNWGTTKTVIVSQHSSATSGVASAGGVMLTVSVTGPIPSGRGTVSIVDGSRGTSLRTMTVGIAPIALGIDARHKRLFVLNWGRAIPALASSDPGSVIVLDMSKGTIVSTIALGSTPTDFAIDGRHGRVLVLSTTTSAPGSDAWQWLPGWVQDVLPFFPRSISHPNAWSSSLTVLSG